MLTQTQENSISIRGKTRAQTPANQVPKVNSEIPQNIVSDQFFVASVGSPFQKWRLQRGRELQGKNVTAYANVNCRLFLDDQNPVLDLEQFDFATFRSALNKMSSSEGGTIAVCLEFAGTRNGQSSLELHERIEEGFVSRVDNWSVGDVVFIKGFANTREWTPLPAKDNWSGHESTLGNDDVRVFVVNTAFSSYLAKKASSFELGNVDVFIDIERPLALDATTLLSESDKSVIREAVSKLDGVDKMTLQFVSHFGEPKDYATISDEFPKEAAVSLKSLGFKRVGVGVDMGAGLYYFSVPDTRPNWSKFMEDHRLSDE